jgi:hypothetical protein
MHSPFDPRGSHTVIVDRMIGQAYPTVRLVAENMEYVKHLSHYMEQLYDIHGKLGDLQNFTTNYQVVQDLLADMTVFNALYADLSNINLAATNMDDIIHINANIANLLAAEQSISDSIDTVNGFITAFGDLSTAISQAEAAATASAGSASSASDDAGLAKDWANKTYNVPVLLGEYSAKHYATVAGQNSSMAALWADEAEDVEVQTGKYSAKHWAQKALDAVQINNISLMHFAGDGTSDPLELAFAPGSVNNIEVNIRGLGTQPRGIFTLDGTNLHPPAGTVWPLYDDVESAGLGWNIEVIYANAIEIGAPADGTVTSPKVAANAINASKIDASDKAAIVNKLELNDPSYFTGFKLVVGPVDLNNDITIYPGTCASDDATPALISLKTPLTKRVDASWVAGNEQGGLDTGSLTPSVTYHLWVIRNPTTEVVDVIFSLSPTAPTLPTGFTQKQYLWPVIRGSTGWWKFTHQGNYFAMVDTYYVGAAVSTTAALVTAPGVPTGRNMLVDLGVGVFDNGVNLVALVSSPLAGDYVPATGTYATAITSGSSRWDYTTAKVLTNSSAQFRLRGNAAISNFSAFTIGYAFNR